MRDADREPMGASPATARTDLGGGREVSVPPAEERVETVSDSVRRTEVEVDDSRSTAQTPEDAAGTPPRR